MKKTLSSLLFCASASLLTAQQALANEFFPVASEAKYQYVMIPASGVETRTATMQQIDTYGSNWVKYDNFLGLQNVWVWRSPTSQAIYVWDSEQGKAVKLVDFSDPAGTRYQLNLSPSMSGLAACMQEAVLDSVKPQDVLADGKKHDVITVRFEGGCRDGGIEKALFARDLGLVGWSEITLMGANQYQLIDAEINGADVFDLAGLKAEFLLPQQPVARSEVHPGLVPVYVTLTNPTDETITWTFPSSQMFDIVIRNAAGDVVQQWSANKRFAQVITNLAVAPHETVKLGDLVVLRDMNGNNLPSGEYTVTIEVKGSPIQPQTNRLRFEATLNL